MKDLQTLTKWGNSYGIRISRDYIRELNLTPDQIIEVTITKKSIVLTPQEEPVSSLDTLLAGVSPEIVGGELEWGDDLGNEVYV